MKKLITLFAIFTLVFAPIAIARMTTTLLDGQEAAGGAGIAYDAASDSSGVAGEGVSELEWSHTVTGSNPAIFVGVGTYDNSTEPSVTYGGDALALIYTNDADSDTFHTYLFFKSSGVKTGANDVTVTLGISQTYAQAGAVSLTGVHQSSTVDTPAIADACTVDVSSTSGDWVIDTIFTDDNAITVGADQTERVNFVVASDASFAMSTEAGSATATMSWSNCVGSTAMGGVSINPAP